MTAIVSGNGLGLFNTSLTQLGGTLGDLPGLGQGTTSQYFNVVNGGLILQGRDESLLSRGLLVDYTRTYNSRGVLANQAQAGQDLWTFEFESTVKLAAGTLNTAGSSLTKTLADGTVLTFSYDTAKGLYVNTAGDGAHDTIAYSATSKTYTWTEGSSLRQEVYDAPGRLTLIRDTKTGAQDVLDRDSQGRVTRLAAAGGAYMEVSYDGNSRVGGVRVIDSDKQVVSACKYTYNTAGRLESIVVDLTPQSKGSLLSDGTMDNWADNVGGANTFVTRYEYTPETGKLKRAERGIGQSDGFEVAYDYYSDDRLKSITIGNASEGSAQTVTFTYEAGATNVTDQAGRTWTYRYDAKGQLTDVLSPAENGLRQVTHIEYDADGNVTRVLDAENRESVYRYDANGNCIYQRDNAGNTVRRTFDARNQLLTQTLYTVADPDGDGAQQASGALTTRNVYDANERLAYTVGAMGEVTQYRYDATTGLVASTLVFDAQRFAVDGLAETAAPSKAALDSWAAQALTAPAGTVPAVTRVDFGYDARGLLVTKTAFATVDNAGNGVVDATALLTRYSYDSTGRLHIQSTVRGGNVLDSTTYDYDGLGRLVGTTDAAGARTSYLNNDSGQALVVTQATGLVRTEAYDKAGQILSVSQAAVGDAQNTRVERRFFDASGRLRATQDAMGGRAYFFYDAAGRMTAQVDATGAVTEFGRDKTGKLLSTTAYATRVDTSGWLLNGAVVPERIEAVRPATNTLDRTSKSAYDAAGRLSRQTDAEGTVTTYTYDGASRLVSVSTSRPSDPAAGERVTRFFFDASGRQVATLDAEGYLVEHRFDAGGREVAQVRYARATDAALRASGSLDALRPAASDHDQVTRAFYNGRDLKVGELDAEGYFTEFVYDEGARQRAVRRYDLQLTGLTGSETLLALKSRLQSSAVRQTRMVYDARGLLSTAIDAEGNVTQYTYDQGGRLVRTERAVGTTDARVGMQRLNAFGEVVAELGGEGSSRWRAGMTAAEEDALYATYGIRHTYDALGRRIESIDAEGNKTWYFYDAGSRLTRTVRGVQDEAGVRNALGEITEMRYDTFGDVTETFAYSDRVVLGAPFGRAQVEAALTAAWYLRAQASHQSAAFDHLGRLTEMVDANQVRHRTTYTAFGERENESVEVEPGRFIATHYTYDRRGFLKTTDEAGLRGTSQEVDAFGRVTRLVDGASNSTYLDYDRLGRQVTVLDRLGKTTSTRYDAHGRVLGQVDAKGNETTYTYDDATRSVVVRTPEGVTLRTEHNAHGETVHVVDADNVETFYKYDHDGHLTETRDAFGSSGQQYDARGLLSRSVDATGRVVVYRYDAAGRLLKRIEDPSETRQSGEYRGLDLTTTYRYDGQGRQVSVVDPTGVTTRMRYDGVGQLLEVVQDDPKPGQTGLALRTTYTWDGLGRQLSVTEAAGTAAQRRTTVHFDDLGRRTSETVEGGTLSFTTSYVYDAKDNLVQRTDAEGHVSRMAYDAENRLVVEVDADGAVLWHGYDANGREVATRAYVNRIDATGLPAGASPEAILARVVADDARDVRSYSVLDRDGRAALVIDGAGGATETRFDAAGRVTAVRTYAKPIALTAGLEAQLGRGEAAAASLPNRTADAQDVVEYRVYDAAGRVRYRIAGDGSVSRMDYDAAGRTVGMVRYVKRANSATIAALAAGTATADTVAAGLVADAGDLRQFSVFDAAGRARYSIDGAGNVEAVYLDADGRTVGSRRYAKPIAVTDLQASLAAGTLRPADIEARLVADDVHDLRSYQVLDALGRVRFTVDGAGAVQEFAVNTQGEVTAVARLATPIALTAQLSADLAAGRMSVDALDRLVTRDASRDPRELRLLDAVGRLRFAVHENGAVEELQYDGTGRITATLAYPRTLGDATMQQLASGALTLDGLQALLAGDRGGARLVRTVYDAAGHARFTLTRLDSGAYAVQQSDFDGAGQVTRQTRYAAAIAEPATLSVASIQAAVAGAADIRVTSFAYDAAGEQVFAVDATGAVTETVHDGAGRVVETRAYDRLATPGETNAATLRAALAGATARVTRTVFDAAGQVHSTVDALGHADFFEYDGAGQKTAYVNRDGFRWTYAYDAAGRMTRETSPPVEVAQIVLAPQTPEEVARGDAPRILSQAPVTRSIVTAFEYDGLGNVTARTEDAEGAARRTDYGYDARGRQVLTTFPDAGQYDPVTGTIRSTGRPTIRVTYDALDRAVVQKDVQDNYSYRVYDRAGQLRFEVDAEGYVTGYDYDAYGEQTRLTRYAQPVSGLTGQALSVGDIQARLTPDAAADRTLTTRYSARGEKLEVQQDLVTWYDAAGTAFQARPTTRFAYNAYGELRRESVLLEGDANAANATWADTTHYYDAAGRQVAVVDAENYVTTFRYDAHGELIEQTEFARALAGSPDLNAMPAPVASTDPSIGFDRTTAFGYDALGRKVTERVHRHVRDADGVAAEVDIETRIGYDNEGHATSVTAGGMATRTHYDALGRVTAVLEPERQVAAADLATRLTAAGTHLGDAASTTTASTYTRTRYDAFGNVVELRRFANSAAPGDGEPAESAGDQIQLNRYDRQGRSVWERDAAGTVYERTYDAADHVLSSRMRLDGTGGRWAWVTTRAAYDRLGRQTDSIVERELHRGDGLEAGATGPVVDTASFVRYNAFGEIIAKADERTGLDVEKGHVSFDYDKAGRLASSDAEGGVTRFYGYNLAGQQVRETHKTLINATIQTGETIVTADHDAVTLSLNDRLGRVVLQRLPTAGVDADQTVLVQRRYDRWGNVLEIVDPRGGHTFYEYNEQNQATREVKPRVKVVSQSGVETWETPTTEWYYDGLGRQVGMRDANGVLRRNYYDGAGQLIRSVDGNQVATRHVYDVLGNETYTEDGDGHITYRDFDSAGRVVGHGDYLTRATGTVRDRTAQESYRLNQNGNRLEVTDALGNTVRYDYDSRGLLVRSRTAAGVVMAYAYDRQGHKIRETNALSDPNLLQEPTPIYRGGLPEDVTIKQGQAFTLDLASDLFRLSTSDGLSIQERVTVEHWNETTHQYELVSGWSYDAAQRRVSLNLSQAGIYRVAVTGSTAAGTSATASTLVNVIGEAQWNQFGWATRPQAVKGLTEVAGVPGGAFQVDVPAGMFTSPTGEPLKFKWYVWQAHREWEEGGGGVAKLAQAPSSGYSVQVWDWVPVESSALAGIVVDPTTGRITGILPSTSSYELGTTIQLGVAAVAGNSESNPVAVKVGPQATTAPATRRQAHDAAGALVFDKGGHAVYLDEQTWAYDTFGRVVEHHDLGGVGYSYDYDTRTGQLAGQGSGWADAAREYSTPIRDYRLDGGDFEWSGSVADALRRWVGLGVPNAGQPELLSDPSRTIRYYANGQIARISEGWNWTAYTYDANGNRTSEESYTHTGNGVLHVRTNVEYDALNRIVHVTQDDLTPVEPGEFTKRLLDLRYDYDAVGNRRHVLARGAYGDNQVSIATTNLPPTAGPIASQSALVGEPWSFTVPAGTFADPEGAPLSYVVSTTDGRPVPAWLQFDSSTQTFSGTPTELDSIHLRVTVRDVDGNEAYTDFTLDAVANLPPEVQGAIGPQTAYVGSAWSFAVPAGVFMDPEGRALHYTATLADGSVLPPWLSLSDSGLFSGVPDAQANYRIHLVATDSAGAAVSVDFDLNTVQVSEPFNPDFELGDTGWEKVGNWGIEAGGGTPYGVWKAVDHGYGDSRIINKVRIPVVTGQSVTARCDYAQGRASAWDNWGAVEILWFDANGNRLTTSRGNAIGSSDGGINGWHTSSVTATAPAGAAYATVAGFSHKSRSYDTAFDHFSIVAGPQPPKASGTFTQYAQVGTEWSFSVGSGSSPGNSNGGWYEWAPRDGTPYSDYTWLSFDAQTGTFRGTPPTEGTRAFRVTMRDSYERILGYINVDLVVSAAGSGGGGAGGGGGGGGDGGVVVNAQFLSAQAAFAQMSMVRVDEPGDGGMPPEDPGAYDAPSDYKSYWYSYDRENRVQVVNGDLVNGEIVIAHNDISYSLGYDDAGHATQRLFYPGGVNLSAEYTTYTERGERQTILVDGAVTEKYVYDAAGRATQHLEYYTLASGKGEAAVGMLKHAEIYTFDADGRLLRQNVYGRPVNWTPPAPPPPPPAPRTNTSGAGAPRLNELPDPYGYVVEAGQQSGFALGPMTFVDDEGDAVTYTVTKPAWLTYTHNSDGHLFSANLPADAVEHTADVTLRATDSHGNWTEVTFTVTVDSTAPDPRGTGGGYTPLMFASVVAVPVEPDPLRELTMVSIVNYGDGAYDRAGRLTAYTYTSLALEDGASAGDVTGFRQTFVYQYEARESYLEKQVSGWSANLSGGTSYFRATNTYSEYDAWGRRTAVREQTPKFDKRDQLDDRVRYFTYDREGMILQRREGTVANGAFSETTTKAERYAFVSGQQVARGTRGGELDVVGRLTAYQATGTGEISITVQAGDTLRSIAQRVYGNSDLWYVLAEANSLGDRDLIEGNQIRVPDLKVSANDAGTFKPYNPADVVGSTAPALPYITPPPKHHCNALAIVLMIVITVVVTVVTYGALTSATTGFWASTAGAFVAGGIAGAAGSAAGQAFGSLTGVASFSWKKVAVDGLVNAATAGFGAAAKAGEIGGTIGEMLKDSNWARAAAVAVVGEASSYAANRLVGNEAHFSWKSIAASAIAAGITSKISDELHIADPNPGMPGGIGDFGKDLARGLIGGIVTMHVRRQFGLEERVDYGQVAINAFGAAVGNAVASPVVEKIQLRRLQKKIDAALAEDAAGDESSSASASDSSSGSTSGATKAASGGLKIVTGAGDEVDSELTGLADKSPTFQKLYGLAKRKKVDIRLVDDPNFSTSTRGKTISINKTDFMAASNQERLRVLAHEMSHALYINGIEGKKTSEAVGDSTYEEFESKYVHAFLMDEGMAKLNEMRVQSEIGVDVTKNQAPKFSDVFTALQGGSINENQAQSQLAEAFKTSNPNHQTITYLQKYQAGARATWGRYIDWAKQQLAANNAWINGATSDNAKNQATLAQWKGAAPPETVKQFTHAINANIAGINRYKAQNTVLMKQIQTTPASVLNGGH